MSIDYEPLARLMGIDEETATEMREAFAALDIEWHCPGRHGVVRDVPKAQAGYVQRVIEWHVGHGACRWTGTSRSKKRSVEFVHMTKVFPAPRKPWEWCGETVLFPKWKAQVEENRAARADFDTLGEPVWFEHKGARKAGAFNGFTRSGRARVLITGEGQWTVPASALRKGR